MVILGVIGLLAMITVILVPSLEREGIPVKRPSKRFARDFVPADSIGTGLSRHSEEELEQL